MLFHQESSSADAMVPWSWSWSPLCLDSKYEMDADKSRKSNVYFRSFFFFLTHPYSPCNTIIILDSSIINLIIAIEHGHLWWFSHFKRWFTVVFCMFTRGYHPYCGPFFHMLPAIFWWFFKVAQRSNTSLDGAWFCWENRCTRHPWLVSQQISVVFL